MESIVEKKHYNSSNSKKKNVYTDISQNLYQTDHPDVKCTKLPEFWRIKKSLQEKFRIYFQNDICKDGTKVTVRAGNKKNPYADIKNNEAIVHFGVAEFSDLRFVSPSGRDTKFNVFFILDTSPPQIISYMNAIKVTVDGPRPKRPPKNKINDINNQKHDILYSNNELKSATKRKSNDDLNLNSNIENIPLSMSEKKLNLIQENNFHNQCVLEYHKKNLSYHKPHEHHQHHYHQDNENFVSIGSPYSPTASPSYSYIVSPSSIHHDSQINAYDNNSHSSNSSTNSYLSTTNASNNVLDTTKDKIFPNFITTRNSLIESTTRNSLIESNFSCIPNCLMDNDLNIPAYHHNLPHYMNHQIDTLPTGNRNLNHLSSNCLDLNNNISYYSNNHHYPTSAFVLVHPIMYPLTYGIHNT